MKMYKAGVLFAAVTMAFAAPASAEKSLTFGNGWAFWPTQSGTSVSVSGTPISQTSSGGGAAIRWPTTTAPSVWPTGSVSKPWPGIWPASSSGSLSSSTSTSTSGGVISVGTGLGLSGGSGSSANTSTTSGGFTQTAGSPTQVPEPGMLGIFGLSLLGLGIAKRRKKARLG